MNPVEITNCSSLHFMLGFLFWSAAAPAQFNFRYGSHEMQINSKWDRDSACDEQAANFVEKLKISVVVNTILAFSAVILLKIIDKSDYLLYWFLAVSVCNIFRYIVSCSTRFRDLLNLNSKQILRTCFLGALASGILWSLIPIYFMDYTTNSAPFVSIILCGLSAGASVQGGAYAPPVFAMVMPIMLSMTIRGLMLGNLTGVVLAFNMVLYVLVTLRSGLDSQSTFVSMTRLKNDARALADSLELKHAEAQAAALQFFQLANHDPLTGIPNRSSFSKTLDAWLTVHHADNESFFLFLLDLDHFKSINDTLGHSMGDQVLQEVAKRLSDHDTDDRFVARLGGDEFAVLLKSNIGDAEQTRIADHIVSTMSGTFGIGASQVNMGVSIGVVKFPDDGVTAEQLLARADLALYAAKDAGRQSWRRFDLQLLSAAAISHDIEQDLPGALIDGSLEVWWQPQVDIDTGSLTGIEALTRWKHPTHGWIFPPLIVAAAFKTRNSAALTGFVLGKACEMIKALADAQREDLIVAVNVSPREIQSYDLPSLVRRAIEAHAIDARRLELEITEETLLVDESAISALAEIARSGVRLAIDDFGTGCSSIAYLRNLRVDRIKIDRCFVTGIAGREGDRILVQAILGIGRSLGIEVIAEGIETVADALMLRSLGCRAAQGYFYGYPMPPDEFRTRLAEDATSLGIAAHSGSSGRPTRAGAEPQLAMG